MRKNVDFPDMFEPVMRWPLSVREIELETGRTHQIRVQAANAGQYHAHISNDNVLRAGFCFLFNARDAVEFFEGFGSNEKRCESVLLISQPFCSSKTRGP